MHRPFFHTTATATETIHRLREYRLDEPPTHETLCGRPSARVAGVRFGVRAVDMDRAVTCRACLRAMRARDTAAAE
jgi:hypothetical protein